MRAARREALLGLRLKDRGSGWPLEMVLSAAARGWRVTEVGVTYGPRRGGRSKVSGSLCGNRSGRAGYGWSAHLSLPVAGRSGRSWSNVSRGLSRPGWRSEPTVPGATAVSGLSLITLQFQISDHVLRNSSQRAGFYASTGFLISFLFIRTSARLIRSPRVTWWPGNVVTESGLHLHHLVWGILLLLLAGFLGFALDRGSPQTEILAGLFGVGAGLTLDEFALWVHLEDVYWLEEGRASFDAVVVAALIGAVVVLGLAPFDLPHNTSSITTLGLAVLIDVLLAATAILKGKPLTGLLGVFIPLISLVGAIRLAAPDSPWARRRYAPAAVGSLGRRLDGSASPSADGA